MKTKPPAPPPAFGLGWGVPWLLAVLASLLLWAGIINPLVALIGGGVAFFVVPFFVPKPEAASAARTWQLTSLVLALLALSGAAYLSHEAPLDAVKAGVRATLSLGHST